MAKPVPPTNSGTPTKPSRLSRPTGLRLPGRPGPGGATAATPAASAKVAQAKKDGKAGKPPKADKASRRKQIAASYRMTRDADPRIGIILAGVFLVTAAVVTGLLLLLPGSWIFDVITGIFAGLVAALIVFGRRAQKAMYSQLEGRPGGAAAALSMLKRGWKVEPAIAFNRNQDLVHRVVGPPGIVLVGEGNANRLKSLLATERRKHERVASEVTISEVVISDAKGATAAPQNAALPAVPVSKLVNHVSKLPKSLKPAEMTGVLARLKALDANRSNIPLPKGPIPTSTKGTRGNLRGR